MVVMNDVGELDYTDKELAKIGVSIFIRYSTTIAMLTLKHWMTFGNVTS